jgi:hypothetical protein
VSLITRLLTLERQRPPAAAPTPLTEAQWERLARRMLMIYADEGREGLVARLTPTLGADQATRVADRVVERVARVLTALEGQTP